VKEQQNVMRFFVRGNNLKLMGNQEIRTGDFHPLITFKFYSKSSSYSLRTFNWGL